MSMQWPWFAGKQYSDVTALISPIYNSLDSKLYICDNCFLVHVKINLIYSKITKVICVMNRVVQGDTDFNCFFFFLFSHPIVPLYLTHTAGCHVALWVMHPPRAPRSSKWAVAGPRGNLVGCSFLCFPPRRADIFLGTLTEALENREKL